MGPSSVIFRCLLDAPCKVGGNDDLDWNLSCKFKESPKFLGSRATSNQNHVVLANFRWPTDYWAAVNIFSENHNNQLITVSY